jgi:2-polyprenyl-3-methyl-5-hydroxy-6-metoxy-1,4-benzoquinol methylase
VEAALEAEYSAGEDPWRYATDRAAQQKYTTALEMLDDAGLPHGCCAVEIGCGEGFFTEQLAPRCKQLLAVDISPLALERAATRCALHRNVTFRRWDLRRNAPLGTFDLVVCMDVLQYIPRPRPRRRAVANVAASVTAGGALLLSGVLQPAFVEAAWWTKWLPISAKADAALFLASDPALTPRESRATELNLVSLFMAP